MPGAHGGLKPWPSVYHHPQENHWLPAGDTQLAPSLATSLQNGPREQPSASTLRSYYDSSRQPLNISQQTSASAVRDMALRKASSGANRGRVDESVESRPLKSALKQASPRSASSRQSRHDMSDSSLRDRLRMSTIGSFLTRRSSTLSNRMAPSPHLTRSATFLTASSDGTPLSRNYAHQSSRGWNASQPQVDYMADLAPQPVPVATAKILTDDDVYQKAKTNIHRPPKGAQNWFDGFDISSDDEEVPLAELPANEALPSTFTQFDAKSKDPVSRKHNKRESSTRSTFDNIGRNLLPLDPDRSVQTSSTTQPRDSLQSNTTDNNVPSRGRRRDRDSVTTTSHFDDSARSLVSVSEDDRAEHARAAGIVSAMDSHNTGSDIVYSHATAVDMHRPSIPPRKLQNLLSLPRDTYPTPQKPHPVTSPLVRTSTPSVVPSQDLEENADEQYMSLQLHSPRKSEPPLSKLRGQAGTHISSLPEYEESTGAATTDSFPVDVSHMMAVSEEEMALLEMMRNKRAAMQKNSFTEGYRLALKREYEQLMLRRVSAQKAALRILRDHEDQPLVNRGLDYADDDLPSMFDEKDIQKLSSLRQEEVDRTLRLEKFLAMDTTLADSIRHRGTPGEPETDWQAHSTRESRPEKGNTSRPRKKVATSTDPLKDTVGREAKTPSRLGLNDKAADLRFDSPLRFPNPPKSPELIRVRRKSQKTSGTQSPEYLTPNEEAPNFSASIAQRLSEATLSKHKSITASAMREAYATDLNSSIHAELAPAVESNNATPPPRQTTGHPRTGNNSLTSHGSPSLSTSRASPPTPSSAVLTQGEKHAAIEVSGSDDEHSRSRTVLQPAFGRDSHLAPITIPPRRRDKKPRNHYPSALEVIANAEKSHSRVNVAGVSSPTEDVLAAWASLGGSEGTLPRGRRARMLA